MTDLPSFRLADYVLGWTTPEKCGLRAVCLDCGSHNIKHDAIRPCAAGNHVCNARGWDKVPTNADVSSRISLDIGAAMLDDLGIHRSRPWQPRQTGAKALEDAVRHFLGGEGVAVRGNVHISDFAQYRHLRHRSDDDVNLDVTVSRDGVLLAALEVKTTLRADRGRSAIRTLNAALTQHAGSVVPVAAVVTGEPLPSRLRQCAPQTGDRHLLYHVCRPALAHAAGDARGPQHAVWRATQDHVRDFSELPARLRSAVAA